MSSYKQKISQDKRTQKENRNWHKPVKALDHIFLLFKSSVQQRECNEDNLPIEDLINLVNREHTHNPI